MTTFKSLVCIFQTVDSTGKMLSIFFVENFITSKIGSIHFSPQSNLKWDIGKVEFNWVHVIFLFGTRSSRRFREARGAISKFVIPWEQRGLSIIGRVKTVSRDAALQFSYPTVCNGSMIVQMKTAIRWSLGRSVNDGFSETHSFLDELIYVRRWKVETEIYKNSKQTTFLNIRIDRKFVLHIILISKTSSRTSKNWWFPNSQRIQDFQVKKKSWFRLPKCQPLRFACFCAEKKLFNWTTNPTDTNFKLNLKIF